MHAHSSAPSSTNYFTVAATVFQTAADQGACYAPNLSTCGRCTQNNFLQEVANSTPAWQAGAPAETQQTFGYNSTLWGMSKRVAQGREAREVLPS